MSLRPTSQSPRTRPLSVETLESRRLLAAGTVPNAPESNDIPAEFAPLIAEGESQPNDVVPGTGRELLITGDLPQYVSLSQSNSPAFLSRWYYQSSLPLTDLADGEYLLAAAASGENWRTYRIHVEADNVEVTRTHSVQFELGGQFPQQLQVLDQLSQTVVDQVFYDDPITFNNFEYGTYELRFAEAGDDWSFRVLNASDAGIEILEPETPTVHFWDSGPRLVHLFNEEMQLIESRWWYEKDYSLEGHSTGRYFIEHAKSGEISSRLQIDIGTITFSVTDITPARNFVKLGGALPRRVTTIDANTGDVSQFWHYRPTLELPNVGPTHLLIYHAASGETERVLAVDWNGSSVDSVFDVSGAVDEHEILVRDANILVSVPSRTAPIEVVHAPIWGTILSNDPLGPITYHSRSDVSDFDWMLYSRTLPNGKSQLRVARFEMKERENPPLSYFDPFRATVDIALGMPTDQVFSGTSLPRDFVVINQYGPSVDYYNTDGSLRWRFETYTGMASVAVDGDQVVVTQNSFVAFLNAANGAVVSTWTISADTAWVRFINPLGSDTYLIARETTTGQQILEIRDRQGNVEWTCPEPALYPRWATAIDDLIIVADTFNHRVFGIRRGESALTFSIPSLYPNDVRVIDADTILVTEEHADRIWTLKISDLTRQIVMAAADRYDLNLTVNELITLAVSPDSRIDPNAEKSKSKSSVDYAGPNTLYAPNGAVPVGDGTFYVADTDNHRVIHISSEGIVLAEIRGLNNPVKIALV